MVKSDNDVQFLNYKFTLNGQKLFFETNQGFSGEVNPTETPIEHKTWDAAINNYVKMKEEKGKKSNIANNENKGSRPSEPPGPTGTQPSKTDKLPSIGSSANDFFQNYDLEYERDPDESSYSLRFSKNINNRKLYIDVIFNRMDFEEIKYNAPAKYVQIIDFVSSNITESEIQQFIPIDSQIINKKEYDLIDDFHLVKFLCKSSMLERVYPRSKGEFTYEIRYIKKTGNIDLMTIKVYNIDIYDNPNVDLNDTYNFIHR